MTARKPYIVAALLAALTLLAVAQQAQKPSQAPETVIKHVPVRPTSPASGEEMYVNYCAVCHGKDGRGAGPAVSALKVPPTDLTTLAQKNGGRYPAMHVSTILRGETDIPAHGTKDMPVWGPLFWKMSQGHESEVQQRIANLNQYLESIQAK